MENHEVAKARFMEAYDTYGDALFRFCFLRTSDREVATDLVQDTFMRFWDELANGKEVEHARALLYRILRNLIIDWYRKIKSVSLDERLERGSIVEPTSDDCEKIIQGAEINQVRKVLNDLEPTYREVVVLRYVDGLDPQEISEILGETANAVSTRLTRAVQKLRELMHYQV